MEGGTKMKKWKIAAIISGTVVGISGIVGSVFAFLNQKKTKDSLIEQESDLEQTDIEGTPAEDAEETSEESDSAQ